MEEPYFNAILPATVRYDANLSPQIKLLFAEITALCDCSGSCPAETGYFATLYNVPESSVSSWLDALNKSGYIAKDNTHIFLKTRLM